MENKTLLAVLIMLVLLAFFQNSIRSILVQGFSRAHAGMGAGLAALGDMRSALETGRERRMADVDFDEGRWKATYAVGGLAHTLFFFAFLVCDLYAVMLSFRSLLGGFEGALPRLPMDLSLLLALAVVVTAAYAGWTLKELAHERGYLTPIHHLTRFALRWLRRAAWATVTLAAFVVVLLGAFRGYALLAQATNVVSVSIDSAGGPATLNQIASSATATAPSWLEQAATYGANGATPLLLLLTSAIAWVFGPAMLLKLLPLALYFGSLMLVAGAARLLAFLRWVLEVSGAFLNAVLKFLIRVGTVICRPVVALFRAIYDTADRRVESDTRGAFVNSIATIAAALASWAWEVELSAGLLMRAAEEEAETTSPVGSNGRNPRTSRVRAANRPVVQQP